MSKAEPQQSQDEHTPCFDDKNPPSVARESDRVPQTRNKKTTARSCRRERRGRQRTTEPTCNFQVQQTPDLTGGVGPQERGKDLEATFTAGRRGGDVLGGLQQGGPEGGRVVPGVGALPDEQIVRHVHGAPALAVGLVDERLDQLRRFKFIFPFWANAGDGRHRGVRAKNGFHIEAPDGRALDLLAMPLAAQGYQCFVPIERTMTHGP